MGTISANFSYSEFERSETAKNAGITNVITDVRVRNAVRELTLTILQPLRDRSGGQVIISSGFRCRALNALVGGSETSQHPLGEAADIMSRVRTPLQLARLIVEMKLPFDQLILYPTFVHVSHKLEGAQRGQILYNRRYYGPKI
jgi:uncharacterized protein YcbK (DUF882 family)